MTYPYATAPARQMGRFFASAATAAMVTVFAGAAMAQQPPAQQRPAPQRPAPAKPAAPAAKPAAPAAQQAPAPNGQQAQAPAQQQPQLIYSPWTKFCMKGQEKDAKQVCFTGKDARVESGQSVIAAVLIEPEGADAKKVLRVTVPLSAQLTYGTRVIVDQGQPIQAPYLMCVPQGCMSDYEVTPPIVASMKKGQGLTIQAVMMNGQQLNLALPLADFAKAHDGPPIDPKVFEEQQKKLQEELQKRALEARQKLEQAQPQKTQ